jgi:hypothetical protein
MLTRHTEETGTTATYGAQKVRRAWANGLQERSCVYRQRKAFPLFFCFFLVNLIPAVMLISAPGKETRQAVDAIDDHRPT